MFNTLENGFMVSRTTHANICIFLSEKFWLKSTIAAPLGSEPKLGVRARPFENFFIMKHGPGNARGRR